MNLWWRHVEPWFATIERDLIARAAFASVTAGDLGGDFSTFIGSSGPAAVAGYANVTVPDAFDGCPELTPPD